MDISNKQKKCANEKAGRRTGICVLAYTLYRNNNV